MSAASSGGLCDHAPRGRRRGGAGTLSVRRPRNASGGEQWAMKYRGLIAMVAVLALCTSACSGPTPAKASSAPVNSEASAPRLTVGVATAHQQDLVRTAQTQGALFPKEKAVLATEVSGAIAQVYADLGDQVKPGQVLLRIDAREYQLRADSAQAQLEQAQARLANASSSFERMREMNREHL